MNRYMRSVFMVSLSCIAFQFVHSQSNTAKFYHLTPTDGLSQATVFDIEQDSLGYIWIATAEGLNRYDGENMDVFTHDPLDEQSLSFDYIRKIFIDPKNNVWIGTANGLDLYNRATSNFKNYNRSGYPLNGLPNQNVSDINSTSNGQLWITTRNDDGLISKFSPSTGEFEHVQHALTKEPINRIAVDHSGKLYMAHENGFVTSYDPLFEEFEKIDSFQQDILSIFINSQGEIWVGADYSGIKVYHKDGSTLSLNTATGNGLAMNSNIPWDFQEDEQGNMWIATDAGLHKVNLANEHLSYYTHDDDLDQSISSNFILSLLIDKDQRIWSGTAASGISIYDPKAPQFHHVHRSQTTSNLLSNDVIWSFCSRDEESMMIGTNNGLNIYDPISGVTKVFFHDNNDPTSLSNNRVWALLPSDQIREYWLGTSSGLNRMRLTGNQTATFESWQPNLDDPNSISANSVRCLFQTGPDSLWLGTSNDGLNLFHIGEEQFTVYKNDPTDEFSISSDQIRCIYETGDGELWIGTGNGLNKMVGPGRFVNYLADPEANTTSSDNNVRVIYEDSNRRLWLGTDYGLNLIKRDSPSFDTRRFTTNDGLPNNRIYAIVEDDNGFLWLSTNRGISKFDPTTFQFENYSFIDGLQSDEFNQLSAFKKDSLLFFGGINGFNYFNPNEVSRSDNLPELVFTHLEIEYEPIQILQSGGSELDFHHAGNIVLKPGQRSFALEFIGLDYGEFNENIYAYRLDDYDKDWYQSGRLNKAVYTNIPPGQYTFHVKVGTKDGIWSDKVLSKNITIRPFFWQTFWFQVLSLLSIAGLVFLGFKWRVKSLTTDNLKLEEGIAKRTRQIEQQKEKLEETVRQLKSTQAHLIRQEKLASIGQLTAGIAHEINNPINYIKNSSEALEFDIKDLQPLFQILLNTGQIDPEELTEKISDVKSKIDLELLINEINALVQSIQDGSERTTDIIKSLRYFSHGNESKREKIDIHDPIESSLVILKNSYKDGIEIVRSFDTSIPRVLAKPGEINQVFLNLLNNSIQALKGAGHIWITSKVEADNVVVYIEDDGPGIPKHIQSQIFEPFYTTKEVGHGTGLGLAISRKIVADHGGEISYRDRDPKGACFILSLPL